jgi:hypothetical protein
MVASMRSKPTRGLGRERDAATFIRRRKSERDKRRFNEKATSEVDVAL